MLGVMVDSTLIRFEDSCQCNRNTGDGESFLIAPIDRHQTLVSPRWVEHHMIVWTDWIPFAMEVSFSFFFLH